MELGRAREFATNRTKRGNFYPGNLKSNHKKTASQLWNDEKVYWLLRTLILVIASNHLYLTIHTATNTLQKETTIFYQSQVWSFPSFENKIPDQRGWRSYQKKSIHHVANVPRRSGDCQGNAWKRCMRRLRSKESSMGECELWKRFLPGMQWYS